jgi:hypothetical protein
LFRGGEFLVEEFGRVPVDERGFAGLEVELDGRCCGEGVWLAGGRSPRHDDASGSFAASVDLLVAKKE